jgi:hypothetical protein
VADVDVEARGCVKIHWKNGEKTVCGMWLATWDWNQKHARVYPLRLAKRKRSLTCKRCIGQLAAEEHFKKNSKRSVEQQVSDQCL